MKRKQFLTRPAVSMDTIPKLFLQRTKDWKNRVAMRKKDLGIWKDITWEEYRQEAEIAGMALRGLGVEKGNCISILSEGRPEWLFCDLGAVCIGAVTVGVYTTNSPDEVEFILSHSESKVLFVENEEQLDKALAVRDKLPLLKRIIVYDMKGLRDFMDPRVTSFDEFRKTGELEIKKDTGLFVKLALAVKPQDIALIVYTSGTTGRPKGAMLSHGNVIWANGQLVECGNYYGDEEALSFLPLCHVAERNNTTFMQLMIGEVVNFAERMDTVPIDLREISPHIFFAVPRFWEKFYSQIQLAVRNGTWFEQQVFKLALKVGDKTSRLKLARKNVPPWLFVMNAIADFAVFRNVRRSIGLDRGRSIASGGAPIAPEILAFFHAVGLRIKEVYGQTEDTGPTSVHIRDDIKLGTVGKPIPGSEVKIADDGEILVKGPHVFQGYLKEPALSAEYIVDGWLHSGDVGEFDDEGYLRITDRKKDIIVTAGGKNITPQYIENKLKFSIYINDAVVIGDRRSYLTCLIMIDKENVTEYAQNNRIPFTTYKSLCHNRDIIALIDKEVQIVNSQLARVENIRKFRMIDVELTADDPELTATMKLKRKYVNEKFKELISEMY